MDVEAAYLFFGVVVIFLALIPIIYSSFRHKSYEEVLAEQKQQSNLYNQQQRPKLKDKKQKKASKKIKDKKQSNNGAKESEDDEVKQEVELVEPLVKETHKNNHVEFKEASEVEEIIPEPVKQRKQSTGSRNAMKPILINKDTSAETKPDPKQSTVLTNHFEQTHPKDDLELLNSHVADEACKKKTSKITSESEPQTAKNKKTAKHHVNEVISKTGEIERIEQLIIGESTVQTNGITNVPTKDKKKKKSELNVLTKSADDKHGISLADLMPLVRKAEMTRVEVQILIDMLLNKQQDAPVLEDWSEGKGDPVQKLKKQLADREKQITELQDSLTASQSKLRTLRTEQNTEVSLLLQKIRKLEEALMMNKHNTERNMQTIEVKCEQFKEEAMQGRKIVDEYKNLKMQHDIYFAQIQEANVTIAQLQAQSHNMQQMQHNLAIQKEELDKKDLAIHELKERNSNGENTMTAVTCQNEELKKQISQMKSEIQRAAEEVRRLEHGKSQEVQTLKKSKDEMEHNNDKLTNEVQMVKSELKKMEEQKNEIVAELKDEFVKVVKLNTILTDENSKLLDKTTKLSDETTKLTDEKRNLQEAKTNGTADLSKQHEMELTKLNNEIKNAQTLLLQNKKQYSDKLEHLQKEIDEQKNKNNDLRQKNWKVMEALQVAEGRNKAGGGMKDVPGDTKLTKLEERNAYKLFIEKVFPKMQIPDLQADKWEEKVAETVSKYIATTSTKTTPSDNASEVKKLQTQIGDYKKIIDATEDMLDGLQKHIEQEEIRWRKELQLKDSFIQKLQKNTPVDYNDISTNGDVLN